MLPLHIMRIEEVSELKTGEKIKEAYII